MKSSLVSSKEFLVGICSRYELRLPTVFKCEFDYILDLINKALMSEGNSMDYVDLVECELKSLATSNMLAKYISVRDITQINVLVENISEARGRLTSGKE